MSLNWTGPSTSPSAPAWIQLAKRIRRRIIDVVHESGSGHVGGALSEVELLVALYYGFLRIDPKLPDAPERDRFVLSKGHGGLGLAVVLAERGFFDWPADDNDRFGQTGYPLGMHMDHHKVAGVEISSGSLGHGLGQAVGMALGARMLKQSWRTVCLLSDGELYEGSTWEAILLGGSTGLSSLYAIVDRNGLTMDGRTEELLPLEPIDEKFRAFGWDPVRIDGHDFDAIFGALEAAGSGRPRAIIADTVKGKGVDFMEGVAKWHYGSLDSQMYARALESIDADGAR